MLTRIKSLSDERLISVGKALQRIGLTPNRLSILGLLLIVFAAGFLYHERILLAILFGAIGALADVADGMVARTTDQKTVRGGFLDSMIDRYADTLIIGAILLGGWLEPLDLGSWEWEPLTSISGEVWAIGALSGALITSYARAAAERLGVKQEGVGWVERPERLGIILLGLIVGFITWALFLLTILGHLTVLQRAKHFWDNAEPSTP